MEENPYAPPFEDGSLTPPVAGDALYFRDGEFLVVRNGAELPPVCVRTNAPETGTSWRGKVAMRWAPRWTYLIPLAAFIMNSFLAAIAILIVMRIVANTVRVTYSLSAESRAVVLRKRAAGSFLFLVGIVLIAAFVSPMQRNFSGDPWWIVGLGGVVIMISAVTIILRASPLRIVSVSNGWFRLKGCSPAFLASLPVHGSPF
ncbi:hypothetical protein OKA04_20865 [Luteolibacter flavescens]|uniref:Uncharacterized protein n=1 Tax=Luteolibacter flavescens TaxID=1859460 RepID=A0ABT3FUD3_9BACT|nr:hypothetical protein [Luteolibacter flavescens]MCW1887203.1 hypothetical protein [Luteolibacter flavescens]